MEPHPLDPLSGPNAGRMSLYHRLLQMPSGLPIHRRSESLTRPQDPISRRPESLPRQQDLVSRQPHRKASDGTATSTIESFRGQSQSGTTRAPPYANPFADPSEHPTHITLPPSPPAPRRAATIQTSAGYTPIIEHVKQAVPPGVLPATITPDTRLNLTADELGRVVAVATVSALRHGAAGDVARARASGVTSAYDAHTSGGHGGHDAPSWSRLTSASVLLLCTLLYAIIAGEPGA